jgi:hypothetical protein
MTPTNRPSSRQAPLDHHSHDAHHARHGHAEHDGLYNEDVAHEDEDVNISQLISYTIGLALMCVVSGVIVLGLFRMFENQAAKNDPVLSPLVQPAGQLPPEPRLVENEPLMLEKHRKTEAEILGKYGWVDQAAGVARLPIDEAKKLLLHKGLPIRPGVATEPWMGTHSPAYGESSSGRAIPVKPGAMVPPASPAPAAPAQPAGEHKAPAAGHKGGF